MFLVKMDDIDELMEISRQLCIFTYLQSLLIYDINNQAVGLHNYKISNGDVMNFIVDNQESCAAELRNLVCRKGFAQSADEQK